MELAASCVANRFHPCFIFALRCCSGNLGSARPGKVSFRKRQQASFWQAVQAVQACSSRCARFATTVASIACMNNMPGKRVKTHQGWLAGSRSRESGFSCLSSHRFSLICRSTSVYQPQELSPRPGAVTEYLGSLSSLLL
jgi:hypothetical protein